eukprot:s9123_g3.t1
MISHPSVVLAGLGSVAFDILDGVDLTDEDIIRTICAWIDKGQVAAVLWQQTRACSFAPKSLQHMNMMRRFGCLLLATAGPVHDVVAGQWAVAGGQPSSGPKNTCMAFLAFLFWTVGPICLDKDKHTLDEGNKTAKVAFRIVLSGVAGRDFKTKSAEQYPLEFASMFFRLLCPSPV